MSDNQNSKRIFIIAGEASGDLLGARLIESLRYFEGSTLEFAGIGGEKMLAQGFDSLFPMQEIALMGFAEILPHAWRLLCRIKDTCEAIMQFRPDIIITIDSPGFVFRVIEWVRKTYGRKIRCIHYVAPTVWAYKPYRARHTAELFDHLLTLLPFEPRYFQAYGLETTFTGHPVVDDLGTHYQPPIPYNKGEKLHLALFPGSRKGEITQFLPVFRDTVTKLREHYPDMQVSIPINEMVLPLIDLHDWMERPSLVLGEQARLAALHSAHLALTKTGTVSLEIAKYGLPMVATYKVNPLTAALLRRMINIPYVNLINIIAGKNIIPELMQEQCNPDDLSNAVMALLMNEEARFNQNAEAMKVLEVMRNPKGVLASDAAAQVILSYL